MKLKKKRRFLFINNMAAPYQVKFCNELQQYFEAEIWFYVALEKNRPKWWLMPLGDKCKVLKNSFYLPGFNYNNFGLLKQIKAYKPDIILLGGFFFPTHYVIKRWAKKNSVKVIILSERIRLGREQSLKSTLKVFLKRLTFSFFKDIDLLFAMGTKPLQQYVNVFGFDKDRVSVVQYPQDIDKNLFHSLRATKTNPRLIFPNKLDRSYNPLFALRVFFSVHNKYPDVTLSMNTMGELKQQCVDFIKQNDLEHCVSFIEGIKTWDELPEIYKNADIALFTATDSNGPNSLIECMASGTGVVMSKHIYNTSSYTIHNKNCFICDLDIDLFVDAISRYIEEGGLLYMHGELSKKLVANRSISATARLYYELIEEKLFKGTIE